MAKRIQRKRIKGWRMPPNTIYVGRPSKWGNPFRWQDVVESDSESVNRLYAIKDFKNWLDGQFPGLYEMQRHWLLAEIKQLKDKNLACWCPPDQPCHADVLIEMANVETGAEVG